MLASEEEGKKEGEEAMTKDGGIKCRKKRDPEESSLRRFTVSHFTTSYT